MKDLNKKEALTVKFISYRKSVKSHCQIKDLNILSLKWGVKLAPEKLQLQIINTKTNH
jgi:hypothetical protein